MLPCGEMAKLLAFLPHLRLPVALACVGLLIADAYLGVGLSETVTMIAAGAAGALGIKRPGDLSAKAVAALKESNESAND